MLSIGDSFQESKIRSGVREVRGCIMLHAKLLKYKCYLADFRPWPRWSLATIEDWSENDPLFLGLHLEWICLRSNPILNNSPTITPGISEDFFRDLIRGFHTHLELSSNIGKTSVACSTSSSYAPSQIRTVEALSYVFRLMYLTHFLFTIDLINTDSVNP